VAARLATEQPACFTGPPPTSLEALEEVPVARRKSKSEPIQFQQELAKIKARDREAKQSQDRADADRQRKRERIPEIIDAMRHYPGPAGDRTGERDWLDSLESLITALSDAGKADMLDSLPDRGEGRAFTQHCIALLRKEKQPQALALFDGIEWQGQFACDWSQERMIDLPDDLCRLLSIPQPPPTKRAFTTDLNGTTGFSENEAAVLKAMRKLHPIRAKVADLEGSLDLNEKTIRECLKSLASRQLVTPSQGKSGRTLTDAGLTLSENLPGDAGTKLFRNTR
jgi:hypothetical protein